MLESVTSVLAGLKQTTPAILLGVSLASAFGVLASDGILGALGLAELRGQYRAHLGVALLISASLLLGQGSLTLGRALIDRQGKRRRGAQKLDQMQKSLHALTPDEKAYLVPFVFGHETTMYLHIEDGVAGGLVGQNILFRASSVGDMRRGFAHNMQPWAREYLEANPHLLDNANPSPKPWSRW